MESTMPADKSLRLRRMHFSMKTLISHFLMTSFNVHFILINLSNEW